MNWGIFDIRLTQGWKIVTALMFLYAVVSYAGVVFVPYAAHLYPAAVLALGIVYFGGLRLWPLMALEVTLISVLSVYAPWPGVALHIISTVAQAVVGAYLLRSARIDPLFRKYRDTLILILSVVVISFVAPLRDLIIGMLYGREEAVILFRSYVSTFFCFLIITPFMLRWCTKPAFRRSTTEIFETLSFFVLLISLDVAYFTEHIFTIFGIPLVDLLLIPLFIIALRMRPRFVTLALFITSFVAVASVLQYSSPLNLTQNLFSIEVFLITYANAFYIVVSLEEDRRVTDNMMHSQLATLENAVARVSSESNSKNHFIAILAHELRNPLAPVMSGIELMKLKGSRDIEDEGMLDMMADRMTTVRQLLNDLLDISRIAEGKVTLNTEPVQLEDVLQKAILSTAHHRKELHQTLEWHDETQQDVYVAGDSVRLEQIFSNLLTNASKYSKSGSHIDISVHAHNDKVQIDVVDQGIGLTPEQAEIIFQPFHQEALGHHNKSGLGIGLALVRNFVDMHGGTVVATSTGKNMGSTFSVTFPVLRRDATKKSASPMSSLMNLSARPSSSLSHVLLVDDNDAAAAALGRLLEMQGYEVTYAYDGTQAIQKARQSVQDTIILDIGLPDMTGYDVARAIRANGFEGKLIALTGFGKHDSTKPENEGLFNHVLVKPAELAELKKVLSGQ
jgi:signal transduction histidine kinase